MFNFCVHCLEWLHLCLKEFGANHTHFCSLDLVHACLLFHALSDFPLQCFPQIMTSRCIALHRIRNEIPNHKSPLSPPLNLIVLVLAHPGIPYTSTAFGGVIISSGAARCRAILIVIPTPKQAVKKATQMHRRITYVFYIGLMRSFVHFHTILCFRKYLI
ncbi:hypothetical protein BKA61DRAFT_102930 [Leptodontidium sp. MPI-SDFR-AT-0119]|nr:hypothetical protein BKA61DRAFT_102930 [Leptodontidium sp. MPI-SDFR-AT-0119]